MLFERITIDKVCPYKSLVTNINCVHKSKEQLISDVSVLYPHGTPRASWKSPRGIPLSADTKQSHIDGTECQ